MQDALQDALQAMHLLSQLMRLPLPPLRAAVIKVLNDVADANHPIVQTIALNIDEQSRQECEFLAKQLADYLSEVGAEMPKPNPNYDPNKEPARKGGGKGKGGKKPMQNE